LAVRFELDERGVPLLRPVTEDRLRHHLARWAQWDRPAKKGGRIARAPPTAAERLPPLHRPVAKAKV
jgi:hypothetical protein